MLYTRILVGHQIITAVKKVLLFNILSIFLIFGAHAQVVNETISIGTGYTEQTWYSLMDGSTYTASKSEWDLAFDLSGIGTSILVNSSKGVNLWLYPGDNSDYATLDTTGMSTTWKKLYNSDTSWAYGAFSRVQNGLSIGWGTYDPITHVITGDSIYVIQLANGNYRKLEIQDLTSGTYHFRQASLDNSFNADHTLTKSDFPGKNFGYFDLDSETSLDREPYYQSWDLLFTQYTGYLPAPYTVSGVLSNYNTEVAEAYPVDAATYTDYSSHSFTKHINGIGYDWKSFDFMSGWVLEDSLVYFVKAMNSSVWKLVFTDFGGSADGNFYFSKEQVYVSGLQNANEDFFLNAYPNPANDQLNVAFDLQGDQETEIALTNLSGRVLRQRVINAFGLEVVTLDVDDLESGIYLLRVQNGGRVKSQKIVIR